MHWLVCGLLLATLGAQAAESLPLHRQGELIRMVRQDCGSCHGMKLTGGLGPALTREALAGTPLLALKATIYHGRPGTPMPPWRSMISESEAEWIASKLLQGFPSETPNKDKP